jgi:hypothetical protein
MLVTEPPRANGRPRGEALAVGLLCSALLAALALLPGDWRLLALPLALVAGAAIERYRQAGRKRPLSLADTPQEWRRTLGAVGWRYALPALVATAGALGVLSLPEFRSAHPGNGVGERSRGGQRSAVSQLPQVEVLRRRPGIPVRVRGASFRVFLPAAEPWAEAIRSRNAGSGASWVVLGIDGRNLARRQFNPNALSYRLRDARGNRFAPLIGGGTGPASLGRTGVLDRGETAQARLGFRVPRSARRLTLVFEPVSDGSIQVEVPLARKSGG